ncbi:cysteate-C-fatty acyltransferase-like [Rhinoderma darwinii]|uniref:cysteate-C-fatty acyltransferase-like n=1 Tax=Rhinoderma darwinii TaxID=43563 RepID=UPI003F6799D4
MIDSKKDIFSRIIANEGGPIGKYRKQVHGYLAFPKLEGEISNRMKFKGKEKIVWSLNNYLGLANHPEIREIDAKASKDYGLGSPMGARMMTGNTDLHEMLEVELAQFVQKEDSILLNYGYQGIMSAIDCICTRHDVVVYDAESHACIIDGLRLHPGHRFVFKHNDIEDCEKQLQRAEALLKNKPEGGILVITEGVFGMAGDQGKIKEIITLKKKYDFRLLVDDAHGFGTLGETGFGIGEEQNCQKDIDLYFSTFAKSMASIGAFIAGDKNIIDFIRYNIRSQIFAKSMPMAFVIGNLKRLEVIKKNPQLKNNLWENVNSLQKGLKACGCDIGKTNTPVTPVYMKGGIEEASMMAIDLREKHNIFCSIITYPVIPKGQIIYRLIPTAIHTKEDIETTLNAFSITQKKLIQGDYKTSSMPQL